VDSGSDGSNEVLQLTLEQEEKLLTETLGDLFPRTRQEKAVVSFVERYLSREMPPKASEHRKYLIERVGSEWQVTYVTIESPQRNERTHNLVVHVTQKGTRFKVTKLTAP